jgi:hypothetical protein
MRSLRTPIGLAGALAAALALAAAPAAADMLKPLAVRVVSVTTPVARGTEGHLVVHTAPYAECGASVQAQSDPGRTIASLPAQTAGGDGMVTFTVKVPGIARPGSYPVTVSCQGDGRLAEARLHVTVR